MKEEVLNRIRKTYIDKINNQKRCLKNEAKIKALEEDEKVKEYLSALKNREKVDYDIHSSSDKLMYEAFKENISYIDKINDIFFCNGTYLPIDRKHLVFGREHLTVKRSELDEPFNIYKSIENNYSIEVPQSKVEEFEKKHCIIHSKTNNKQREYQTYQKIFIKDCLELSQEEAVIKIKRQIRRKNIKK